MENESKPQKRGRKPKNVKTEEPLIKNVIIEEPKKQSVLNDEIPEPEPELEPELELESLIEIADEIPESVLEEKTIDEFIEELNNEIENPKEEMKAVLEEIFEELKDIISEIEEPKEEKEPKESINSDLEKREEVIEETIIEEIKESVETIIEEVVNKNLEIKSLLNLLIIISVRQDMQEKYGLSQELVKILQLIIQTNSVFFFKIEESFKKILEDNKIDSDDVPELMSLFSTVYELLFSLKLKTNTIDISNICGDLIKLTFNIMLTENIIIFESSGSEETLKIFNALVDSSISLIKLSKTVKFSNKCCFFW
jgi:hypothetical protein